MAKPNHPKKTATLPAACPGFSADEWLRLVAWMRDAKRHPAVVSFTAGHLRDAATAFEQATKARP